MIRRIHDDSRGTYGMPRVHAELVEGGCRVGRKRVARLMRESGLVGVSRRRGTRTTRVDRNHRVAPDRVERQFRADAPDKIWVADVTYVPTWTGFVQPDVSVPTNNSAPTRTAQCDQGAGAPWTPSRGKEPKIQDSIQRPGNSKTGEAEPVCGGELVAVRGTQVLRTVVPRAATQHPGVATPPSRPCTPVPRRPSVAGVPTVLHPLHHISVHVMQPKRVRRERAHRRRAPSVETVVRLLRRYRRTEVKRPRRPRACHVLPLRLAQQPVRLACHPRQPPHVRLRILPAHIDDRPSPPAPALVIRIV